MTAVAAPAPTRDEAARAGYLTQVMGMPVSVHLRGPEPRGEAAVAAVAAVFAELGEVDVLFSTYRDASEVSLINAGALRVDDAHPWVRAVLELADLARVRTGGLFDVHLPTGDLAERAAVAASGAANPPRPHRRGLADAPAHRTLDPSGLVKGWAVERAARWLRGVPHHDFCLNAGGDVMVGTARESSGSWRTAVEDPRPGGSLLGVLELRDGGVATSGSRARGDHLVDPRDGSRPRELLSVTVVGPSLQWADVLATAAFVRGSDAVAWLERAVGYRAVAVLAGGGVVTSPGLGLERVPTRPAAGANAWTSSTTSAMESTTLVGR